MKLHLFGLAVLSLAAVASSSLAQSRNPAPTEVKAGQSAVGEITNAQPFGCHYIDLERGERVTVNQTGGSAFGLAPILQVGRGADCGSVTS